MLIQLFPVEDKLSRRRQIIYQVLDRNLISSLSSGDVQKSVFNTFNLNYIWKHKIYRFTSTIIVSVFYKLQLNFKLKSWPGLDIYNGPGIKSKRIRFYSNFLSLSANQAFCVMYVNSSAKETEDINYKSLNLMYLAIEKIQ